MVRYRIQTDPSSIFYISWTVDAYEGIGFVRTDSPREGWISLFCPACSRNEVDILLRAFQAEGIPIRILEVEMESLFQEKEPSN